MLSAFASRGARVGRWGQWPGRDDRSIRTKRGSDLISMRSKKGLWIVRMQIASKRFDINNLIFTVRKASICFRINAIEDQGKTPGPARHGPIWNSGPAIRARRFLRDRALPGPVACAPIPGGRTQLELSNRGLSWSVTNPRLIPSAEITACQRAGVRRTW